MQDQLQSEWAEVCFSSYGIHLKLSANDPVLLATAERYFPPGWTPASESANQINADRSYQLTVQHDCYTLTTELGERARSAHLEEVLAAFASDSRLFIGEMARRWVFLHAGVVSWGGRAILIPGRSFSGKTSLVAELVKAGAIYFSDEYAVLDLQGRVHPYLKPLSLRDAVTGRQIDHSVASLGGESATEAATVGLVLITGYQAGAVWQPSVVSAGEGVLALADNSLSIRHAPQQVLSTLRQSVAGATILKSARGEARQVVGYLQQQAARV